MDTNLSRMIKRMPHDYPKMKREGILLETDYSSVAFDFAYKDTSNCKRVHETILKKYPSLNPSAHNDE